MKNEAESGKNHSRRGVLTWMLMSVGLIAGYGAGALHFFQYLIPLRNERKRREMFVGTLADIVVGATRTVRDPSGQEIIVARTSKNADAPSRDFRALSTKCPHLGCKVHWEAGHDRFRCPCHEGIFDKEGKAISGPPAQEGKNLIEYEVRVDQKTGWVFVMVAQDSTHGA